MRTRLSRLLWFDERVRAGDHPGSAGLAARFGMSSRTARRDIAFLRDKVSAPLVLRRGRGGYEYTDQGFHLPSSFFRKEELLSLLLAKRLFGGVRLPCGEESEAVLASIHDVFKGNPLLSRAEGAVTFGDLEEWGPSGKIFLELFRGILKERTVLLRSHPERGREDAAREVEPLRLHFQRGIWYLAGRCRSEGRIRLFDLARIRAVEAGDRPFRRGDSSREVEACLAKAEGIARSGRIRNVRLRFDPAAASRADVKSWFPERKIQIEFDGAEVVHIPSVGFSELVGLLLLHGGGARILSPRDAADVVEAEAGRVADHRSPKGRQDGGGRSRRFGGRPERTSFLKTLNRT
jgi:predicted DNA-binding transcriptional regulator YafY